MRRRVEQTYRRMKPKLHWFLHNEGASLSLSIIVLLITIFLFIERSPKDMNPIDYTVFLTVITAVCLNFAAIFLSKFLARYLEDDLKLTVEYDQLAKKYHEDMFEVKNDTALGVKEENLHVLSKIKKVEIKDQQLIFKLPVVKVADLYNHTLEIKDDRDWNYKLPDDVKAEYGHLFKAHASSKIYNQLNIRVNNWYENGNGIFVMETGRTTYFDSLVTNRSMDYKWTTGVTTRDLYNYGPFLADLNESNLSNHLGFNGIIESADGFIPFIKRGRNVSVAKGAFATNIAASLKVKYALDDEKRFTEVGLHRAIIEEIQDELKLKKDSLEPLNLHNNVISAYRDVVEGGKPQLLIYGKSKLTKEGISKNFEQKRKMKKQNKFEKNHIEFQVLEDGTHFMWVHKSDLNKMAFSAEYMIHQGKAYSMVPSTVASIYMIKEHLQKLGEISTNE